MKYTLTKTRTSRAVLIGDLHSPNYDERAVKVLLKTLKKIKPDFVVIMGDVMDFDIISRFNLDNLLLKEGRRLAEDFAVTNELLDKIQGCVGKKTKVCLLMGNHDVYVEKLYSKHPELQGLFDFDERLKIEERGWNLVEYVDKGGINFLQIGDLYMYHGVYVGSNHGMQHVQRFNRNIAYGHLHTMSQVSSYAPQDEEPLNAYCVGFLAKKNMGYLKGAPSNWQHGFAIVDFLPSGEHQLNLVKIMGDKAIVDGKTIK